MSAGMKPWDERATSTCKGCGGDIRWIRFTATGKNAPVDSEPSGAGTLVVDRDGGARVDPAYGGDRYTAHFSTCSQAAQFRRKG